MNIILVYIIGTIIRGATAYLAYRLIERFCRVELLNSIYHRSCIMVACWIIIAPISFVSIDDYHPLEKTFSEPCSQFSVRQSSEQGSITNVLRSAIASPSSISSAENSANSNIIDFVKSNHGSGLIVLYTLLVVISLTIIRQYLMLRKLFKLPVITDGRFLSVLEMAKNEYNVKGRSIKLQDSSGILVAPCCFANRIFLPTAKLQSYSDYELKLILVHEISHIIREDYLWKIFGGVISNIFFFNPFIKLLLRRGEEFAEQQCDSAAVVVMQEKHPDVRQDYSKLLLNLSIGDSCMIVPGWKSSLKSLKNRLKQIVAPEKPAAKISIIKLILQSFIALIFIFSLYFIPVDCRLIYANETFVPDMKETFLTREVTSEAQIAYLESKKEHTEQLHKRNIASKIDLLNIEKDILNLKKALYKNSQSDHPKYHEAINRLIAIEQEFLENKIILCEKNIASQADVAQAKWALLTVKLEQCGISESERRAYVKEMREILKNKLEIEITLMNRNFSSPLKVESRKAELIDFENKYQDLLDNE